MRFSTVMGAVVLAYAVNGQDINGAALNSEVAKRSPQIPGFDLNSITNLMGSFTNIMNTFKGVGGLLGIGSNPTTTPVTPQLPAAPIIPQQPTQPLPLPVQNGVPIQNGVVNSNPLAVPAAPKSNRRRSMREEFPSCSDDGTISMDYRQVHRDSAMSLVSLIDAISGGRDRHSFKPTEMVIELGDSESPVTDIKIKIQMPRDMVCDGVVSGIKGLCVVQVHQRATVEPLGGPIVFFQSDRARKSAFEFRRLKKRQEGPFHSR